MNSRTARSIVLGKSHHQSSLSRDHESLGILIPLLPLDVSFVKSLRRICAFSTGTLSVLALFDEMCQELSVSTFVLLVLRLEIGIEAVPRTSRQHRKTPKPILYGDICTSQGLI